MQTNYPTTFVIFGATGDLSEKKLFPALFGLYRKKLLPMHFKIVAFARRPFTDAEFGQLITPGIQAIHSDADEDGVKAFLGRITYHQGLFDEIKPYISLINRLGEIDKELGACSHKIFHLAVSPFFYETVLKNLEASALNLSCTDGTGLTRVLIEKPIGTDLASAKKINKLLSDVFMEGQIFRVDHYLAKNALYNLLTLHASEKNLQKFWNPEYIQSISIRLYEKITAHGRGAFYDRIGAVRDVGQNHMLEMLALLLIEKLPSVGDRDTREFRARALKDVASSAVIQKNVVRAQYDGYLSEEGVAQHSQTETFFSVPLVLKDAKWPELQIVLESGKALNASFVEAEVTFKKLVEFTLAKNPVKKYRAEKLVFRIQPNPVLEVISAEGKTVIPYRDLFEEKTNPPDTYELVYLESLRNDQTRFVGREEIEASWKLTDSLIQALNKTPLAVYEKGADPHKILAR